MTDERSHKTVSGLEVDEVYAPSDIPESIGQPGKYPFTRGVYPTMYRGRRWTMRQYAGFSSTRETNERFRYLLDQGQTGLSVAFDLPTQIGFDSDHPLAKGEVGKVGVPISCLDDMRTLMADIPLDQVSVSMTINSTAAILLAFYLALAEEQGVPFSKLRGTLQNDLLKEYAARGTFRFPPRPSMRIVTDVIDFCAAEVPNWNPISISGYHIREAGSNAPQELAFTLSNGVEYVKAAIERGLSVDDFAPRLSFFFNSFTDLLEEVAKFRAARRMWARLMKERFGATDPKSWRLRFHAQTAGSSLTSQQPLNNVVRTTIQGLAAVLGGCQSLHTNGWDEALALPTAASAKLALRTQQIIGFESMVTETVDPLGGSYYVEALTDRLEAEATAIMDKIDGMGGALAAIEDGYMQHEIQSTAYDTQRSLESNHHSVVGVNRFVEDTEEPVGELQAIDPTIAETRNNALETLRQSRDDGACEESLKALEAAAEGADNLMPKILACVKSGTTLGEIMERLEQVFGEYEDEGNY